MSFRGAARAPFNMYFYLQMTSHFPFYEITGACAHGALLLAKLLLLVVADALDLGGGGALWVKDEAEPLLCELAGELDADDSLTEAEDLAVVGQNRALDGEGVVGGDGSDALDLVGCNGNTETGAADKETSVGLACLDLSSGLDGKVWVCWWRATSAERALARARHPFHPACTHPSCQSSRLHQRPRRT